MMFATVIEAAVQDERWRRRPEDARDFMEAALANLDPFVSVDWEGWTVWLTIESPSAVHALEVATGLMDEIASNCCWSDWRLDKSYALDLETFRSDLNVFDAGTGAAA